MSSEKPDPVNDVLEAIHSECKEITWNGHIKYGEDEIILMFNYEDKDEIAYIETDSEGVEKLIENLKTAKQDLR